MNDSNAHNELPTECDAPGHSLLSRREVLGILGGGAVVSTLHGCGRASSPARTGGALADPLHYSSAVAFARAIREGEITAVDAVTACLDRIDAVNPALNAVVQLDRDGALARAREADAAAGQGEWWGPLHGVPMTIKDSLDTAGMITTGGTTGRASFVPNRDATVVARLKDAGAVLMGKTNTPEFTLSFETDNLVYGRTNNPYDVMRSPGGSSGGAAAIVAAGGAPFDIGSDYGGSIRLPAHFCGIAGIKPSAGRVPRTGHAYPFGGLQDTFQQIGPLARSVDDLILVLPLIMGQDWIDPGVQALEWHDPGAVDIASLRVSFHTDNGVKAPTSETSQAVTAAAAALGGDGAVVTEATPPDIDQLFEFGIPLYFWDGGAAVRRLLSDAGTTDLSAPIQGFVQAPALGAVELDALIERSFQWRSRMSSFLADYDAIVCPVNAGPAIRHGATADPESLAAFSYTFTYNVTGWPGAVVRGGTSAEGLPIGVQIVTRPGREDVALALAQRVEAAMGGYQRPTL